MVTAVLGRLKMPNTSFHMLFCSLNYSWLPCYAWAEMLHYAILLSQLSQDLDSQLQPCVQRAKKSLFSSMFSENNKHYFKWIEQLGSRTME